jgi:hypothetical protein
VPELSPSEAPLIPRATIIGALRSALSAQPSVLAAFLGGSDATGRTDALSDIDLVVVVDAQGGDGPYAGGDAADGDAVEAAFATVHDALAQLGPIAHRWRLPDPTWHGNPQEFLALRDADPAHFIDLVVMRRSGGERFLEPQRHGTALVLFDRAGLIGPEPLDDADLQARIGARLSVLRVRFPLFQTLVTRAVSRGFVAEAAVAYQDHTLRPLIELLRIRHCPQRFDYGARYLDRDLPPEVRAEVESLALPSSPEQVLEFRARAQALFEATLADLDG